MQKRLKFGVGEEVIVKDETLRGIFLDINPIQADGVTVCDIADLNKVSFDVLVKRANGKQEFLHNGWLEDSLRGLYEGTTKLEILKTKRSTGYPIEIQFGGVLQLHKNDELIVNIHAQNTSFTSLHVGNSSINFETIPATNGGSQVYAKVVTKAIANGELSIDKDLEPNTMKVVLATDFTAGYFTTTKAKPTNGIVIKDGTQDVKTISENLLILENLMMFEVNPDSTVGMLVLYTGRPLRAGKLQCKFDKAVDSSAKVITVSGVVI